MLVKGRYSPLMFLPRSFGRKRYDTVLLKRFQQGQAGVDLQLATWVPPFEVFAHCKRQLLAAQVAERLYRLLNSRQLLPREPATAECRLR